MENIRSMLWRLRRLRLLEINHAERANEYLARATQGTSTKQAINISGTGNYPLTDNVGLYTREKEAGARAKAAADAIWGTINPKLKNAELDHHAVIELFYNIGMPWEDIPTAIKRSEKACARMHHDMLCYMERESL
jgi:hypothetical protein